MKLKILCHKRYCENFKIIDWNGEFIEKWFCDKHKKGKGENNGDK